MSRQQSKLDFFEVICMIPIETPDGESRALAEGLSLGLSGAPAPR